MSRDFSHLRIDPFPLDVTDETVSEAKSFAYEKWVERHHELGKDGPSPIDLSDSCKFTALFASVVFGGEITGNYDHVFIEFDNGETLDLNSDAADVAAMDDPYDVDDEFLCEWEFHDALKSCVPRVKQWLSEFALVMEMKAATQSFG